jgi:hypothetical protein
LIELKIMPHRSEAVRHQIVIDLTLRTTDAPQAPTWRNVLPKANIPMVIIRITLTTRRGQTIEIWRTVLARIFSIASQIPHNYNRAMIIATLRQGIIVLVHRSSLDGVVLIHHWNNDSAAIPITRP